MNEVSLNKFIWVNGGISKERNWAIKAQKCSFMNSLSLKKLKISVHIICHLLKFSVYTLSLLEVHI